MSKMFNLDSNDFAKGAITSIVAAVVAVLYGVVFKEGFDLFNTDWMEIGKMTVNAAVYAFVGYIGKNFMTDSHGKVLGRY